MFPARPCGPKLGLISTSLIPVKDSISLSTESAAQGQSYSTRLSFHGSFLSLGAKTKLDLKKKLYIFQRTTQAYRFTLYYKPFVQPPPQPNS